MAIHTIELFAGVGMLGEGLRAGLGYLGEQARTVCYVEREAYAAAVLAARIQEGSLDAAPVWSDVTTFDARRWAGVVDCVVAGFPCQDLSVAGLRAGLDGARSGLFFEVLRIARDCGAEWLFLENVAGIATATAAAVDEAEGALEERAAARVVGELADRGWDAEWITLSASDVGASHGRARWFCLAWRREVGYTGHHAGSAELRKQPENAACWTGESSKGGDEPAVADSERARWQKTWSGSEINTGRELEPRCSDVDDTQRVELAGQRIHPRPGPAGDGAPDTDRPGAAVAHTSQPRLQNAEQPEPAGAWPGLEGRAAPELRGAPLFAPGPLDPRWSAIVSNRPDLAPAVEPGVRMLADGMAYLVDESRAHQLRQVGNGVVPLQAAVALVELVRRAAAG